MERLISLVQIKYLRNCFVVDENFSRMRIVFQVLIDINMYSVKKKVLCQKFDNAVIET